MNNETGNPVIRITFTYADGSQKSLMNDQLAKWLEFQNYVCGFANLHGRQVPWNDIKYVDE